MKKRWIVQEVESNHHGYEWPTFAIRDAVTNYCLAIVGDVDRATAPDNFKNAHLMASAPDLLEVLKRAQAVIDTGDDAGCSPELIVVDSEAYNKLKAALTQLNMLKGR